MLDQRYERATRWQDRVRKPRPLCGEPSNEPALSAVLGASPAPAAGRLRGRHDRDAGGTAVPLLRELRMVRPRAPRRADQLTRPRAGGAALAGRAESLLRLGSDGWLRRLRHLGLAPSLPRMSLG